MLSISKVVNRVNIEKNTFQNILYEIERIAVIYFFIAVIFCFSSSTT